MQSLQSRVSLLAATTCFFFLLLPFHTLNRETSHLTLLGKRPEKSLLSQSGETRNELGKTASNHPTFASSSRALLLCRGKSGGGINSESLLLLPDLEGKTFVILRSIWVDLKDYATFEGGEIWKQVFFLNL